MLPMTVTSPYEKNRVEERIRQISVHGIHSEFGRKGVCSSFLNVIEKALRDTDTKLQTYPYIRAVLLALANNLVLSAVSGTIAGIIVS